MENIGEIYPGLFIAGMAVNASRGGFCMGPIFGGMLLSGEKTAKLILDRIRLDKEKKISERNWGANLQRSKLRSDVRIRASNEAYQITHNFSINDLDNF